MTISNESSIEDQTASAGRVRRFLNERRYVLYFVVFEVALALLGLTIHYGSQVFLPEAEFPQRIAGIIGAYVVILAIFASLIAVGYAIFKVTVVRRRHR